MTSPSPRSIHGARKKWSSRRDRERDRSLSPNRKSRSQQLSDILEEPDLRAKFLKYLESIHADENFRFYDKVLFYEKISPSNHNLLKEKYDEIVAEFIAQGSPSEINVSQGERKKIMKYKNQPAPEAFESAKYCVFVLMTNETLPAFLTAASTHLKLVNMKKIVIPVDLLDIIEFLKDESPNIRHFGYEISNPKILPYVSLEDECLSVASDIDFSILSNRQVGALFKVYLMSFPIPIITAELPIFFEFIIEKDQYLGKNGDLRELINVLPPLNQAVLHLVVEFLYPYKNGSTSFMDLGELFAPLLIRIRRKGKAEEDARTVAYLIEHYEELFMSTRFKYTRENDKLAYTNKNSYPQISVDLYKKYEQDFQERGSFETSLNLSQSDMEIILLGAEVLTFDEESVLIQQGESKIRYIYFLEKGNGYVTKVSNGEENHTNTIKKNEFFGELSVVTTGQASASVTIGPESVVHKISLDNLAILFKEDSMLSMKFYHSLSSRLAKKLLQCDPTMVTGRRSSAQKITNRREQKDWERSQSYYLEKFGIEDPHEKLLKDFDIKNGVLWVGKKYLCWEEMTLFSNKKHKVRQASIVSVQVNVESCSLRLERDRKKTKILAKNPSDLNQIVSLLQTISKELEVEEETAIKSQTISKNENQITHTITDDEWEIILGGSTLTEAKKGDVIVKKGDTFSKLYLISHGSARAEMVVQGETHFLGDIEQGEIFGEISYLLGNNHSCTVIANEKTEFYCIYKRYINLLFHSYPDLATKFFRHLCRILGRRLILRESPPDESDSHDSFLMDRPSDKLNKKLSSRHLISRFKTSSPLASGFTPKRKKRTKKYLI
eukprot:TRINITY_DN1670_c0_g1_i2.p1 TRINITY_DN1670_c0_g1~~TRINITY_DN1670_c0_g1_i2.p1  ORF type:complete len:848 (-),score=165.15 TRINITY_DN1670_c0_g1_i2:282-2792(-)